MMFYDWKPAKRAFEILYPLLYFMKIKDDTIFKYSWTLKKVQKWNSAVFYLLIHLIIIYYDVFHTMHTLVSFIW